VRRRPYASCASNWGPRPSARVRRGRRAMLQRADESESTRTNSVRPQTEIVINRNDDLIDDYSTFGHGLLWCQSTSARFGLNAAVGFRGNGLTCPLEVVPDLARKPSHGASLLGTTSTLGPRKSGRQSIQRRSAGNSCDTRCDLRDRPFDLRGHATSGNHSRIHRKHSFGAAARGGYATNPLSAT